MRLVCPNCGAQYEVPVDVIPAGGRDVQCSNCGHTWYQAHPDQDSGLAEDLGQRAADPDWDGGGATAPRQAEPATAPQAAPNPRPDPRAGAAAASTDPTGVRRQLDDDVAEVLREEAEREARQRAAEAESLSSQPDLGLGTPPEDEAARRSREARERMARMRGEETANPEAERAAAAAAAAAAGSRRDLLPDVEEINQTLRSSGETRVVDSERGQDVSGLDRDGPSGGFGKGFLFVIILIALAVAAYVFAPQIKDAVPETAPLLDAYTGAVDQGRAWLDAQITKLMQTLDSMSSEAATDGDAAAPETDAATEGTAPASE